MRSKLWFFTLQFARGIIRYSGVLHLLRRFSGEHLLHLLSTLGVGKYTRHEAVKLCQKSSVLPFSLIERKQGLYFGAPAKMREEYVSNMYDHIFALVTRGNGNYSFRLYEVMSMGRIPVFFDTDCVLPLEAVIPYRDLFVWVPWYDRSNLDTYLRAYLERNEGQLDTIQRQIRDLYQKYFLPEKYFAYITGEVSHLRPYGS